MELLPEEVDEILDAAFPRGMPPSLVNKAIKTRQCRVISRARQVCDDTEADPAVA